MLIVNICGYGDFDRQYVAATMYHPTATSLKEFSIDRTEFDSERDKSKVITKLKSLGFEMAKNTTNITFGGAY